VDAFTVRPEEFCTEAEAAEARTKKKITIASVAIAVIAVVGGGVLWLPGII
jgi:hypothetical protein